MLFAAPVWIDLLVSDRSREFGYLAADAFYYLTVARNIALHGIISFDQSFATNGFHPLWQFGLAALYGVAHAVGAGGAAIISLTIATNVALIGLAIIWLGCALREPSGRLSPHFLTLPVGGYALLASSMWFAVGSELSEQNLINGSMPLFGTLWSYVNGMETALLLAWLGAVAAVFVRAKPGRPNGPDGRSDGWALGLGALLAAFTLTRLDHIFFAAAILALIAAEGLAQRPGLRPLRPFWLASLACALPIAAYVATNWLFFDTLIPVSGIQKNSFPVVDRGNLDLLWALLSGDSARWLTAAIRMTFMLLPICAAALYLPFAFELAATGRGHGVRLRESLTRFDRFLGALALGASALGIHNFLFVRADYQWHWYYPVSTVFVGLLLIRALDRATVRWLKGSARRVAWMAVVAGISVFYFLQLHRQLDWNTRFADFYYEEAPRLRAHYATDPPRLISFDDGIIAFATGFPTMSGLGFTLDPEAAKALAGGKLLDLAIARGHDRVTSMAYGARGAKRLREDASQRAALSYARSINLYIPLGRYKFRLDYLSPVADFAIVRAMERPTPSPPQPHPEPTVDPR